MENELSTIYQQLSSDLGLGYISYYSRFDTKGKTPLLIKKIINVIQLGLGITSD